MSQRTFGPKAKAGGAGGGAPSVPYVEPKMMPTNLQVLQDRG